MLKFHFVYVIRNCIFGTIENVQSERAKLAIAMLRKSEFTNDFGTH